MLTEFRSVRDVWEKLPTEADARRFLEGIFWHGGRIWIAASQRNCCSTKGGVPLGVDGPDVRRKIPRKLIRISADRRPERQSAPSRPAGAARRRWGYPA
jgi:hypothetical protein